MQNNTIQYVKTYIYNGFFLIFWQQFWLVFGINKSVQEMFTFWSSKVQDGRTYPLNTAYIVALILRRFLSHNYVKHTTHIEILCTLTGFFIRVLLLFYIYSLVWWDFNQRYPVSLYFSFPYYNTLFITGRSSAHASPCVTVGKLFVTSWKYM